MDSDAGLRGRRGTVARCLEVALVTSSVLAILGLPQQWDPIKGAAKSVQRVGALDRWGEFTALYRVESDAGRFLHYMVAEG